MNPSEICPLNIEILSDSLPKRMQRTPVLEYGSRGFVKVYGPRIAHPRVFLFSSLVNTVEALPLDALRAAADFFLAFVRLSWSAVGITFVGCTVGVGVDADSPPPNIELTTLLITLLISSPGR